MWIYIKLRIIVLYSFNNTKSKIILNYYILILFFAKNINYYIHFKKIYIFEYMILSIK